jgi:sugar phosphate permease
MGILTPRRNQMLLTAWAGFFVNYLDRTKTAALLPLIVAALAMTKEQTGWVLFAFFIGYAAVQPIAGFVTDLVGARKTLAVSVAAFSVFTWTMAMVNSWEELLIRNAIFGVAQGFELTAGCRLVATWFPVRTRGRAFAFHQTAYTLGPVIVPFIAVPLAQALGSWRWSFMIIAFFGLPVLAAIDRFVIDRPERDPKISQEELDYIFGAEEMANKQGTVLNPTKAHSQDELPPGERLVSYREIFLNRSVFLMFVAGFFNLIFLWGMATWLPTYGVRQLKLPLLWAGSLSSILYLGSFFGVVAGGILSDKFFGTMRTPVWLLGGLLTAGAIVWAISFQPGVALWEAYLCFFVVGFFTSWTPIGQLYAPYFAELLTPGAVGRAVGVVNLGSQVGSAVAQPLTAMLIIQTATGQQFWPAFVMFAVFGVLTSACVAGTIEPKVGRPYLAYLLSGKKAKTAVGTSAGQTL